MLKQIELSFSELITIKMLLDQEIATAPHVETWTSHVEEMIVLRKRIVDAIQEIQPKVPNE